ncbi:MAG TPA: hypothetical protein H9815_18845 [Candidatus Ruania gallistercoris]|uniref:Uncharacterized protein n=1 Tax=Candidatus Ruania gallistercoris TaxID=2838746 RepID=A0A9D2EI51_9MICO|nr:hypothetical protein [Candidatus Ruania gallistercoris]
MSSLPESIGQLARALSLLFRLPSAAVLVLATASAGLALLLAVVNLTTADPATAGHWVVLGLAVLLALPVALFAIRRRRWLRSVETSTSAVVSTELVGPDELADRVSDQMGSTPGDQDARLVLEAITEGRMPAGMGTGPRARMTRWLGSGRLGVLGHALTRLEQAQRALLVAAGGPMSAPYLKDDLRVSALALFGTLIAIPLAGLLAIILALVLLTG